MTVKEEADIPVKQDVDIPVVAIDGSEPMPPPTAPSQAATASVVSSQAVSVAAPVQATVDVIAPTNMQEGYQFNVDSAGKMLRVAVPPGGVTAGQRFAAIILSDLGGSATGGPNPHKIPNGTWRDGLCDCCKFGCCHPTCCLSFWCTACALGQVMTRNKLDKCGSPYNNNMSAGMSAFKFLFICTTVYFIVVSVLGAIVNANEEDDDPYNTTEDENNIVAVALVQDIIQLIFLIFVLVLMIRTRSYIRSKYAIPAQCCSGNCEGCEDCCCSFWCAPCTVCQMARHTANFDEYQANCCSENGLAAGVPDIV